MKTCPKCHTQLPQEARFCIQCGAPQASNATEGSARMGIDWDQDAATQITSHFFTALRQRVQAEYQEEQYSKFSERLYESGFRDTIQRRALQIGDKLRTQLDLDAISIRVANNRIELLLEELLDFFIIRYCQDLLAYPLPEGILKYQGLSLGEIDLLQIMLDYLDFAHESEIVYTDFLVMPVEKLKNAGRSFLFPEKQEKILLICDQSILGSCKEGFALTEKGIYWKAHLQKARQVMYAHLTSIEKEKDWLNINGHFFNINPSLNAKMLKLLKKIQLLVNLV